MPEVGSVWGRRGAEVLLIWRRVSEPRLYLCSFNKVSCPQGYVARIPWLNTRYYRPLYPEERAKGTVHMPPTFGRGNCSVKHQH